MVFLRVRVTREGQDVRGGVGEDDVGFDLARVEVDDDGAGFGSPDAESSTAVPMTSACSASRDSSPGGLQRYTAAYL